MGRKAKRSPPLDRIDGFAGVRKRREAPIFSALLPAYAGMSLRVCVQLASQAGTADSGIGRPIR
jgi:hypothetical protein